MSLGRQKKCKTCDSKKTHFSWMCISSLNSQGKYSCQRARVQELHQRLHFWQKCSTKSAIAILHRICCIETLRAVWRAKTRCTRTFPIQKMQYAKSKGNKNVLFAHNSQSEILISERLQLAKKDLQRIARNLYTKSEREFSLWCLCNLFFFLCAKVARLYFVHIPISLRCDAQKKKT